MILGKSSEVKPAMELGSDALGQSGRMLAPKGAGIDEKPWAS